ncbi:peptidyl-prolyl cis-trans isomerase [Fodinibius sediminis]|uniref:peptidylprolyl isomerase n=1 Tax=Fodinibius sediminis TaxID=1214077 RepID=A0A521DC27_9BACT|nr:peptidyl-prolyl cis-trans isomerase [Fodinibius sediminis]SMO69196.1 PPIC-type PPIASE domain-containing protein [Fodinibius sediminis]
MKPITWLALLFLLPLGCTQMQPEENPNRIARVGSTYLTLDQAKKAIPSFMYGPDSTAAIEQYRTQWIQQQLVLQEANKLKLEEQEEVQEKLRQARREVLKEALRSHVITSQVDSVVSDQEAIDFYEANKEDFALSEAYVRFRHLAVEGIEDARAAKQSLRDGTAWDTVATTYAQDPEEAIRRARRFQPVSRALSEIEIMNRYLQIIGEGEVSAIQRVNGLYHFVQLTEKKEAGEYADLDWIMEEVKNWIILDKRKRKFNSYLKNLYLRAESNNEIEVFNVLPAKSNSKHTPIDTLESTSTDE